MKESWRILRNELVRHTFQRIPLLHTLFLCLSLSHIPQPLPVEPPAFPKTDWLLDGSAFKAKLYRSPDGRDIILNNGLVRRVFRISPNLACIAFDQVQTGIRFLRAVKPEAWLEMDGKRYAVGGLQGQPNLAFLRRDWIDKMTARPDSFQFRGYTFAPITKRMAWKQTRRSGSTVWPPPGIELILTFDPPSGLFPGLTVQVHYELYSGLPLIGKWLTIHNGTASPICIQRFVSETLAVVEAESIVDDVSRWELPNMAVVTDYSFGGMSVANSNKAVNWEVDKEYATQVNYNLNTPCLLEVKPPLGPDQVVESGRDFRTFRTFELLHDSTDRERKGLAVRRMFRTLAPWVTENPLMLHLTSTNPETVKRAIDQCASVGFEMVIFSFGSGLNMEDDSAANIARFKALADYAHKKGIQLGGYSLLASRRIDDEQDVINPKTGKTGGAIFGNSPCLSSLWGIRYFEKIEHFLEATGFDLLEHDGSFPGDACASIRHIGHRGLEDSQWNQYEQISHFYRWCREKGIYLNVPDYYFLAGSNKCAMGYRESNWSLPRDQQHVHARMHLYDGTWEKSPSMGWMFVPLVQYQGGGAAATIEPLKDHLPDYERHLVNNLGYGAQACYRGPRLYDSPQTQKLVKQWVDWFKKHREILEADIIHLRRPTGQDIDGILHVKPTGQERGMAVFYNPTSELLHGQWDLPLAHTGLSGSAGVSEQNGVIARKVISAKGTVRLDFTIKPGGSTWFVIQK